MTRDLATTLLVADLAASYPSVALEPETFSAYERGLADLAGRDVRLLEAAVDQARAESKFFPSVAEIRERFFRLSSETEHLPAPFEAWGEVLAEVRRVGGYGTPSFSNPVTGRAVEIMGWRRLCSSENEVADRAHFARLYDQLVARRRQDERYLPEARAAVAEVRGRMGARQLTAPRKELPAGGAVPPTEEFMEALRAFSQTKAMPAGDGRAEESPAAGIYEVK